MKLIAGTCQRLLGIAALILAIFPAVTAAVVVHKDAIVNITQSGGNSLCGARPASHICDPEHLLSADTLKRGAEKLAALAALKKSNFCKGYETYVALLDVPETGARAAAMELGGHWGILGSECGNGLVIVYSTRDKVFTMVADKQLEDHALPHTLESYIESSSLGILPHSPDVVINSLINYLGPALDGKLNTHYVTLPKILHSGVEMLLYLTSISLGLAASALFVCCLYDAGSHWRHRAHFHSCQKKVQRVHEFFLSKRGELSLCPYCVNPLSCQSTPSEVVFICGHRFHIDCANRWFHERPEKAGMCPLCECRNDNAHVPDVDEEVGHADEAKTFILNSLHQQYPDIVSSVDVQRWASCHTELWLSELNCPRYHSIFHKPK